MRLMVTGGEGFVGQHLAPALLDELPDGSEITVCRRAPGNRLPAVRTAQLDITDNEQVARVVRAIRPTHLVHLAAVSAVPAATIDPRHAWNVNVLGSLNLALAVGEHCPDCRFIHISSSEVYGATFKGGRALDEGALLDPVSIYGSTKAAADLMMGQMAAQGLSVIRVRPFNHTGPGQTDAFVVSAFAAQIARIEAGRQEPVIRVGNLDSERDFLDVRDVVDAYSRIVLSAESLPSGAIFNVASGVPRRVGDILSGLLALSDARISVAPDQARLRKSEIPVVIGDAGKARQLLGWEPRLAWNETLASVLSYWRDRQS